MKNDILSTNEIRNCILKNLYLLLLIRYIQNMRIQQTLTGTKIILYPFKQEHTSSLRLAADHDDIWTYNKAPNQNRQTFLDTYFKQLQINQEKNTYYTYVVAKQSDNTILGSTRFYDISKHDKRLVIGFTWYSPTVWGTYVNAETKLLLLQHVFESLDFNRGVSCRF